MTTYIHSYGCTTGAGPTADSLFAALKNGVSFVDRGVCRISDVQVSKNPVSKDPVEICVNRLLTALKSCPLDLTKLSRLGVILASTKGGIEDDPEATARVSANRDPATPVLEKFCQSAELNPMRRICISNSCASSHSAVDLAHHWLSQEICDWVLVAAVERVGPFIERGFRSLQALTQTIPSPFSIDRDGLALGEAAAVILLSRQPSAIQITASAVVAEGATVTRPSPNGKGLRKALESALSPSLNGPPKSPQKSSMTSTLQPCDLIIAHATATAANDKIEALVYSELFPNALITGAKWCIGHTLGASGLIDIIAGCEALKRGEYFRLATTVHTSPEFTNRFLLANSPLPELPPQSALICSLGFGGMNATVRIAL